MAHKGLVDESKLESGEINTTDIEGEIGEDYKAGLAEAQKENPEKVYPSYLLANWQMMRGGSQFIPIIVMAIILMFAVLILVIAIVIISFSIKTFIQKNINS